MSESSTHKGAQVTVLGAGSWGTALAQLLAQKNIAVRLWARDAQAAKNLTQTHENAKYLAGFALGDIGAESDLEAALRGATHLVSALPCAAVPDLACTLRNHLSPECILISGTKGLHPESGWRASQMWEKFGGVDAQNFVTLSGPNLAREVVAMIPTSTVVASESEDAARVAQNLFSSRSFRVYTNTDLVGVELGGALKNVVAIAAGISDGLGFGDNAKAAITTRAWREMTRLALALGAQESTLFGLSGMGDLMATCVSPHSRNRSLGERIGRGESLGRAQHEIAQVAEGVHTTRAALQLSKETGVELPVTQQIAAILFDGRSPRDAVAELMSRAGCSELN
jgi:glycerol-3-phosphate dehydrogenase (NAD(P)+)